MGRGRAALRARWILTGLALGVLLITAGALVAAPGAEAHGKELRITVVPLTADPDRPLERLYRVEVIYAGDGEPVTAGQVVLRAERDPAPGAIGPVALTEVEGSAGLYVGEVRFERFGTWTVRLHVEAPGGLGDGSVTFEDEVRPGLLNPAEEAALRAEGERVIRLQLRFGFDWWPDAVNVVMRVLHSVAGLSSFAVSGLAFVLAWLGAPASRPGLPGRVARRYLLLAGISLSTLLGAGLYSAAYDAPTLPPGIYDVSTLVQIPFGEWYLAAFLVKVVMFVLLAVLAVRIHGSLRRWEALGAPSAGAEGVAPSLAALRRETLASMAIGLVLTVDVAVLIYLHYVSHLSVFLPET